MEERCIDCRHNKGPSCKLGGKGIMKCLGSGRFLTHKLFEPKKSIFELMLEQCESATAMLAFDAAWENQGTTAFDVFKRSVGKPDPKLTSLVRELSEKWHARVEAACSDVWYDEAAEIPKEVYDNLASGLKANSAHVLVETKTGEPDIYPWRIWYRKVPLLFEAACWVANPNTFDGVIITPCSDYGDHFFDSYMYHHSWSTPYVSKDWLVRSTVAVTGYPEPTPYISNDGEEEDCDDGEYKADWEEGGGWEYKEGPTCPYLRDCLCTADPDTPMADCPEHFDECAIKIEHKCPEKLEPSDYQRGVDDSSKTATSVAMERDERVKKFMELTAMPFDPVLKSIRVMYLRDTLIEKLSEIGIKDPDKFLKTNEELMEEIDD